MPGKVVKNEYLCYNRKLDLMKTIKYFLLIAILMIIGYAIIHGVIPYI